MSSYKSKPLVYYWDMLICGKSFTVGANEKNVYTQSMISMKKIEYFRI